jgi:hypothetical protein
LWCRLEQLDIAARALNLQLHQSIDVAFDDQKKYSILLALQQLDAAKQTSLDAEKGSDYWTSSYVETVFFYRGWRYRVQLRILFLTGGSAHGALEGTRFESEPVCEWHPCRQRHKYHN